MQNNAVLVDGNWCFGCHSCEVACQMEKKLPETDQMGIQVAKLGVWNYEVNGKEEWQNTFYAIPTDLCDGCAGRLGEGKQPVCATVCPAQALKFGNYEDLAKEVTNARQMLVRIA